MPLFSTAALLHLSTPTQPLPDALRGEKWAFVQLPLSNLREMLQPVGTVSVMDCRQGWMALGGGETVWQQREYIPGHWGSRMLYVCAGGGGRQSGMA